MYEWRNVSELERLHLLERRKERGFPSHNCPHLSGSSGIYHVTSPCFEHESLLVKKEGRLLEFQNALLEFCELNSQKLHAWCVLPNHYHLLLTLPDLKVFVHEHGRFHGRISHQWNGEDGTRGRKFFHGQSDRFIRNEKHYWATVNYIHNNPVHHHYVCKWQDWPYSSVEAFLEEYGREQLLEIWRQYPVKDYGKNWDDF